MEPLAVPRCPRVAPNILIYDRVSFNLRKNLKPECIPRARGFGGRRCALAEGCKNEPRHAGISSCISGSVLHLSPEVCTCRRLQKKTNRGKFMHLLHLSPEVCTCRSRTAAAGISACISGSVRHLPPEVCTCRRLQIPSTAARGSSTCISGPVLHLSPEVCTCRRLQIPSTAARGLSTCISGSVLHLSPEVCAKTNSSTRAFTRVVHCWGTLCGRCALAGTANARTLQRPHSLRVCRWGKHQKREMQRLSRAGVLELVIIVSCFGQ